ncbi:MAG TPA: GNAT family N-acetyltransferase [Sphingorhabdus sp.]|jgi:RimJ/RimL family protein N-acetyltransferase|uniref:GNAT family N-acetyltransferase n=1 Tax=Sphingorhabdus sp. TaxID=1902408 RepID=UPI002C4E0709|nr:GNAT family N-acetyltransferase [Sphingorhabdus sp.]HMT41085.1 GNAT family N-acetyltransferase [Sphingorhabdus sp.]HMU20699.1 GNAT family N-acetyltransferase [Sphingorhabdus sp.]
MFARTERLLLRPSWPEDAGPLYRAIADEGIVRNLAKAPWPYSFEDALRFVGGEQAELFPTFILYLRTEGAPVIVGACGLSERDDATEMGYWIARSYWGRGFASEAGRAVVDIAKTVGHKKLVASHFIDNPTSGTVLRKLGFRQTGKREERFSAGRGYAATTVLYEQDLSGGDGDISDTASMWRIRPTMGEALRAA